MDSNCKDSLALIKLNIARVQDTIKNILLVKKQLQKSSLEAKGEVHSSISRQLEALRSREVWLLDQVDIVQHAKEGILDEQLCHMQHELGAAKTLLATACQNMEFTDQLQTTVTNLEQLSFEPKEDSDMHFAADQRYLRDAIYGFGQIETNKRRIVDSEGANKKACLSDVREVNHGELYRSLTELKEKKDKCLDAAVPQRMLENRDWLIKTPTNTPVEPYSDLLFPPFRRNESLSKWLQKIQEVEDVTSLQNVEEDEDENDDYDMAESDVNSAGFEVISSPYQETQLPGVVRHPYFDEILTSPTKEWLQNPERIRLEHEMGASYPYAVMRYFRDISKDTRVWLAGYDERKKLEQIEEKNKEMMMSCAGQCACTATSHFVQNVEIENLDHLMCMRESTSKSSILQQRCFEDGKEEDEVMLPPIEKVCRANDICGSFSECVCDTKCCGGSSQSESARSSEWSIPELRNQSQWLSSPANKNSSETSKFPCFQRVTSEKDGEWLLSTETQVQPEGVNPLKMYLATRPDKDSDWLASNEQEEMGESSCDDTWLAKRKEEASERETSDVSETIQKHHSCYNNTDWLTSSCRTATSSHSRHNNSQQYDAWKTVVDHHSNYRETDWLSSGKSHDPNVGTNQAPASTTTDVENKEYENWLMSGKKADIGSEDLEKWAGLRKDTQAKVSDWLLGTIPDDIRGIVYKMDGIHLTTPPSKWLLHNQSENPVMDNVVSESNTITSFPCFAQKSPMKTWLKE